MSGTAFGLAAIMLAACCLTGCTGDSAAPPADSVASNDAQTGGKERELPPIEARDAREVLDRMAAAYQAAGAYRDQGRIVLSVTPVEGPAKSDTADFAVAWARPNKLRLQIYKTVVAADGQHLWATISDDGGRFKDDLLEIPCPEKIGLEVVPGDDVLQWATSSAGVAGPSVQLLLLLGEKPLEALLDGTTEVVLGEAEKVEGRWCHRVEASREDGALVFWVDQRTHVLRRLALPTDGMEKNFESQGMKATVRLIAEFRGAELDGRVDEEYFELAPSPHAKKVSRFNPRKLEDPPPQPTKILGQKAPEFPLFDVQNNPLDRAAFSGKILVLDFWATWCEPCQANLPNLQKAYEKFAGNDQVQFLAVSIDTPHDDENDEQLQARLKENFEKLGVTIPIARTDAQAALPALGMEGLPNLIVIGPDGTVQDNEVGLNLNLGRELPRRIERLLQGENLSADAGARYEKKLEEYYRMLDAPAEDVSAEPAKAAIAPFAPPQKLALKRLWSTGDLTSPGNITPIEVDGQTRLLVHDGFRHLVEMSAQGETIERHALDVPEDGPVVALRVGLGPDGKRRYAGLAVGTQQVHVFDHQFQTLFHYPEEKGHAGIADALFADLDNDQQQELYVSYWDVIGVQRVDDDGKRRWGHRDRMNNVISLTVATPAVGETNLLCANAGETSSLMVLTGAGKQRESLSLPNRYLEKIAAADLDGDGKLEYCALSPTPSGRKVAVGFTLEGDELWEQPLAAGIHEQPIEVLATGRFLPDQPAQWLVASPDGAILFIDRQGELIDQFAVGSPLHGLAATVVDGQPLLVFSTANKVEAWGLGAPASPAGEASSEGTDESQGETDGATSEDAPAEADPNDEPAEDQPANDAE